MDCGYEEGDVIKVWQTGQPMRQCLVTKVRADSLGFYELTLLPDPEADDALPCLGSDEGGPTLGSTPGP